MENLKKTEQIIIKSSDRHQRKKCGHCNEMLSYTAFRSHKIRFYDKSTESWLTEGSTEEDKIDKATKNTCTDQPVEDSDVLERMDITESEFGIQPSTIANHPGIAIYVAS